MDTPIFAKNVFEAQEKFLEAIQQMIDDEEVTLDGDDLIGYESFVEQHKIMAATIEWRDAAPVPVKDDKVLYLHKKWEEKL